MTRIESIARDMEIEAKRRGFANRELDRGLRLQLNWVGGFKVLTLSRSLTEPSLEEEIVCRRAFSVPDHARTEHTNHATRLRWQS